MSHPGEEVFAGGHHAHEVKAEQTAEDTEEDAGRYSLDVPGSVNVEGKHRVAAHEDIGEAGGRDASDEDG